MIEVEIKFIIPEEKRKALLDDAVFLGKQTFTDTYYDTKDYKLSIKDIWLRTRDDVFILKIPAAAIEGFSFNAINPKHEIEDESLIRDILKIGKEATLKDDLKNHGFIPLYTYTTTRDSYRKDRFFIDIDHVDYGQFYYDVCEVEVMVEHQDHVDRTLEEIRTFVENLNIPITPIDGKLVYLIRRTNQEHFDILRKTDAKST